MFYTPHYDMIGYTKILQYNVLQYMICYITIGYNKVLQYNVYSTYGHYTNTITSEQYIIGITFYLYISLN